MEALLVLVGLVVVIWLVVRSKRRAAADVQAQEVVERVALALLGQYPAAADEQIVQLIRDELLNRRAREPSLFSWATAETVGRVRRTYGPQIVQAAFEHLVLALITANPSASDAEIVSVFRAGLVERGELDPRLFRRATVHAVEHVRRTAVQTARSPLSAPESTELRAESPARTATIRRQEPASFGNTCPGCGQTNDEDAWKCSACGKILTSAWE